MRAGESADDADVAPEPGWHRASRRVRLFVLGLGTWVGFPLLIVTGTFGIYTLATQRSPEWTGVAVLAVMMVLGGFGWFVMARALGTLRRATTTNADQRRLTAFARRNRLAYAPGRVRQVSWHRRIGGVAQLRDALASGDLSESPRLVVATFEDRTTTIGSFPSFGIGGLAILVPSGWIPTLLVVPRRRGVRPATALGAHDPIVDVRGSVGERYFVRAPRPDHMAARAFVESGMVDLLERHFPKAQLLLTGEEIRIYDPEPFVKLDPDRWQALGDILLLCDAASVPLRTRESREQER